MKTYIGAVVLLGMLAVACTAAEDYPLRKKYSEEKYITTAELAALGDQAVIVDTRDRVEYQVIHIDGAILLQAEGLKEADLLGARGKQDSRAFVFYCNGVLCEKSYRAAQMARVWGFQNCYVYDAGVFDWAKTHPGKTIFFGQPLTQASVGQALISPEKFAAACLELDAFKAKAADPSYKIFDVRDRSDRARKQVKLRDEVRASMDEFVGFLEKGIIVPKQKVLIYDNVGRQVVWLQYHLEKAGVTEYYFLKNGVASLAQ